MDKLGDLYPAFQNALMDNGNLVGWYVDAQPWGWQVLSPDLLEELALSAPTTFDELLDVSKVLFDSGLLSRDYARIQVHAAGYAHVLFAPVLDCF